MYVKLAKSKCTHIAITKGRAIEKSPILLSQYWKNEEFELIQQAPLRSNRGEGIW